MLASYGYLAVLFFVAIESTGIPFPGETLLLVAAASGAILGDNLGFWVGSEGGYRLLRPYGRCIHL